MAGTAKGKHSRSGYVELVHALHVGRHSGHLTVTHGRRTRQVFFVAGRPVLYQSDLPEEELSRTLVYSELVPDDRVKWIAEKLSPGEKLEEALVMSGSLSAEALDEHIRSRTRPGIAGALTWSSGTWAFRMLPSSVADGFDPRLLVGETALPFLWNGVNKHVGTDEVLPAVTAAKKGSLHVSESGLALIEAIGLSEPFSEIGEAIGSGASVEDVFRKIPDNSGALFKLLWMLENGGAIQRENGSWTGDISKILLQVEAEISADGVSVGLPVGLPEGLPEQKKPKLKRPAKQAKEIGSDADVAQAHRERMGQDFYTFLGLDPACPRQDVDKACKDLAQRWRTIDSATGLSAESRKMLKDLLGGVQLAWRTLTDPKHKREYDRRLEMGRAPKVELRPSRSEVGLSTKTGSASAKKESAPSAKAEEQVEEESNAVKGRNLLNRNQFAAAAKVLEEARIDSPSDPKVLANLGWARWKAREWGKDEDEPLEFLRLALTFEPKNIRALEFLARINIEKGDSEKAQAILKRILKITPGSEWARSALLSQQKGQRSETVTRRGFWRGKGDKP